MRPAELRPLGDDLANCAGDRLCESCRFLFEAAQVLLEARVEDEARIVPTLVATARRPDLPNLARLAHEFSDVSVGSKAERGLKTRFHNVFGPAEAEEVIGGVLIVRREPFYVRLNLLEKLGDPIESVTIDVHSRPVKAEDLAGKYDRALQKAGVPIDRLGRGGVSYRTYPGCLEILVRPEMPEMGGWEQMLARGRPRTEQLPFPPSTIVQSVYKAIVQAYGHVLAGRERGSGFKPENLILACVAWYVGRRGRLIEEGEDKDRAARVLDKHVLDPLGFEKEKLGTRSDYNAQNIWNVVERASRLIERVDSDLEASHSAFPDPDGFS